MRDPPDHNSREHHRLSGFGIGHSPSVSNHYLVVLGDDVCYRDMQVRKFPECTCDVSLRSGRAGREVGRDVRSMVYKLRSEVYVRDVEVLTIDEFLKMAEDELLGLASVMPVLS